MYARWFFTASNQDGLTRAIRIYLRALQDCLSLKQTNLIGRSKRHQLAQHEEHMHGTLILAKHVKVKFCYVGVRYEKKAPSPNMFSRPPHPFQGQEHASKTCRKGFAHTRDSKHPMGEVDLWGQRRQNLAHIKTQGQSAFGFCAFFFMNNESMTTAYMIVPIYCKRAFLGKRKTSSAPP